MCEASEIAKQVCEARGIAKQVCRRHHRDVVLASGDGIEELDGFEGGCFKEEQEGKGNGPATNSQSSETQSASLREGLCESSSGFGLGLGLAEEFRLVGGTRTRRRIQTLS